MNLVDLNSDKIIRTMSCKLSVCNSLMTIVEETFTDGEYSILAYDELGDIWEEKFTNSELKALEIQEKLYNKYTKNITR